MLNDFPIRLGKKARRRWRKAARTMGSLEKINPMIAEGGKRIAEIYTTIALSRRKEKPKSPR
jgi:hypothetical protein